MTDLFYSIIDSIEVHKNLITIVASGCLGIMFYFGIHPLRAKEDATTKEFLVALLRRINLLVLFVFIPILLLFVYVMSKKLTGDSEYFKQFFNETIYGFKGSWALYVAIVVGTITFKFTYERVIEPNVSHLIRKYRVKQTNEKMSDIRSEISETKTKDFDPRKYFKDGYMFLGLDEKGNPIYEKDEDFKKRHSKIVGPSQTGKGVLQGVILYQAILKGWCTGFFDIKPDDFIYPIMCKACKEAGRPEPIVVDLNGVGPGSYNMFTNGTQRERTSRTQFALNINDTGTNADFYSVTERSIMFDIEKHFTDGKLETLEQLLSGKMPDGNEKPDYWEKTQKSRAYIKEMKAHKPLNPRKGRGFNVDKTIEAGAVFLIRGSVTDKLVKKAQTVMLMDFIQSVLRLGKQERHFYLAIDEVKFIVSDMLSTGLSTVLSKGMNMSLAYQSNANLLSLEDKTLNASAIKSEIEINTLTTISYRAADDDTAEWAAKMTGTRNKTIVRSEGIEYSKLGAETYTGQKQLHEDQEELIPMNKMKSLPERVAALIRPNQLAQVLYTCWIPLEKGEHFDIPKKENKKQKASQSKNPEKKTDEKQVEVIDEVEAIETTGRSAPSNKDYSFDDFMAEAGLFPKEK